MVTLQTCTPIPTFERRLIVRADRVQERVLEFAEERRFSIVSLARIDEPSDPEGNFSVCVYLGSHPFCASFVTQLAFVPNRG